MILNYLSALWTSFAPAFGNHLWQSTLFAVVAGLLTLVLRNNHARTRYMIWLAASVKFLVPFSLLVELGKHFAWSQGSAATRSVLYLAMTTAGQPFTRPAVPMYPPAALLSDSANLTHLLPAGLAVVWLCGFLAVLCLWTLRWRRISAVAREAVELHEGREVKILREVERTRGVKKPIEMRLSIGSLEPGVFGIIRPVLVWPQGISERLEDAHLEAIFAHELMHVRRHDNLAAALHMLVEAIFWFYPLVWWMGGRLLEERERACDEAVLDSGSDRKVCAESILKICEFCVGSPMACMSGVTGADLKKRILHIMSERMTRNLDLSRKLLLGAAGVLTVATPITFGLIHATQTQAQSQPQNATAILPTFETSVIRPNKNGEPMARFGFTLVGRPAVGIMWKSDRLMATNFSLQMLIQRAYDLQDDQISGGPDWLNAEKYDVDAKMDKPTLDALSKLSPDTGRLERQRMLQSLLADRFKLVLHRETKNLVVYALAYTNPGPHLQEAKPGDTYSNGVKCFGGRPCGAGVILEPEKNQIVGQGIPLAPLLKVLSEKLGGRIIEDKTGLAGKYDFTLKWPPDGNQDSLFTAIHEQLGLRLESQEGPVELLVIDHAEPPSGN